MLIFQFLYSFVSCQVYTIYMYSLFGVGQLFQRQSKHNIRKLLWLSLDAQSSSSAPDSRAKPLSMTSVCMTAWFCFPLYECPKLSLLALSHWLFRGHVARHQTPVQWPQCAWQIRFVSHWMSFQAQSSHSLPLLSARRTQSDWKISDDNV